MEVGEISRWPAALRGISSYVPLSDAGSFWKGSQMAAEIAVQLSSRQPRKLWERPKRGRRSFREERFEDARTVKSLSRPPS